jgi:carbon storage regulator
LAGSVAQLGYSQYANVAVQMRANAVAQSLSGARRSRTGRDLEKLVKDERNLAGGKHMLVLSRKEKQTILVGDDIEITICRVSGRRVTIGLRAPDEVSIRRGEVRSVDDTAWSGQPGLLSRLHGARQRDLEIDLPHEMTIE